MITSIRPDTSIEGHKVLLVDDHPILRHGLARLLKQELVVEVYEGPENVADALEQIRSLQPDLVVVDISLKDCLGIELITLTRAEDERTRFLVLSAFDEDLYAERAIRAGARGYVHKGQPLSIVVEAVACVLRGNIYLSPHMTSRVLSRVNGNEPFEANPLAQLSNRELEVFRWIGRGVTTQEIARQLAVTTKTIEAHRENIKRKLDLKNAAELNRRAFQCAWEQGDLPGNGHA